MQKIEKAPLKAGLYALSGCILAILALVSPLIPLVNIGVLVSIAGGLFIGGKRL